MIESIAEIGKWALEKKQKTVVDQLIEDHGYPYAMNILLKEEDGTFVFVGIEVEEAHIDFKKYLFRNGSPRGTNYSPTARITTVDNTFHQKVLGWLKKVKDDEDHYFHSIYELLVSKHEEVVSQLQEKIDQLKDRAILSLKINNKFLYDLPLFVDKFLFMVNEKDLELYTEEKVCSVCGEKKDVVIGKMSVFRFYTLDKPGFITGGFHESLAWRNFPVCLNCKSFIEEGRKIIEEKLRFQFYGLSYLLIPKFILPSQTNSEDYEDILYLLFSQSKDIRLQDRKIQSFMTTEEDILAVLADAKNTISLQLLFLQKIQSAERILLLIEDVLPSRLREIFQAKAHVEKVLSFTDRQFHFGMVRTFFNSDAERYFLTIVDRVFKKEPIHITFLLSFIMKEIRRDFYEIESNANFFYKVRQAISVILFLEQCGVLKMRGGSVVPGKFDVLFETFGQQLDTNEKKAIFLLGALTQMLLEIQWKERGSQPFVKQLMGLKMDERTVKGLLPKVINKLKEYDAYQRSHHLLAEDISSLFMMAQKNWKLSVDELNFYFVCGMNLVSKVKECLFEQKGEQENVEQSI
ncbi:TIGR02556 family CRISPR-associated protein [Anoxybacillus suryakundensis]|uniref:CRISPR-associated protein, Csh1 family n=1 Tax=Anoxybacillus suryakundensis TaxID=1325335 RepID=A0A0K6GN85_9BACL|nr:TIGR02556 family CRISPR-associated protein [Anoxybacillus suryakundensis]CUA79986.1 CRISPR-associated protein, Csh1 family [Anoxybacillus suryakundensis]